MSICLSYFHIPKVLSSFQVNYKSLYFCFLNLVWYQPILNQCPIIIFERPQEFQMLYEKENSKIPKKTAEKLAKFSYYVDTFYPDFFQMKQKTLDLENNVDRPLNQLLIKPGNRNITYSYFYSKCENSAAINIDSILGSVKKLYLSQDVIKINEMSYSRQNILKQSYLPVYGYFSEIIDFVLIVDKQEKPQNLQKSKVSLRTRVGNKYVSNANSIGISCTNEISKLLKPLSKPKSYWLYVIHNCNSFKQEQGQLRKITWQHFIQRYHFTERNLADSQSKSTIEYELVYSYKSGSSFLSFQQSLTRVFIESHCKVVQPGNTLQNLDKLQGYLLQRSSQVQANQDRQKDVAFSDEHRRQTKIPIQYFKQYIALKKQIYQYYVNLHEQQSEQQINKYFYQNLICRYLVAKDYNFQESRKSIIEYLKWQKDMKDRFPSLDSFKEYHELGAYRIIGEDFMGRPVVLSKATLIDVNKLPNIEMYCDYYIYFLQIHLRTQMRGYVDQMLVIGDLTDLGARNMKLAITKRNVSDSLKYGPERQHGLIIVHASTFAYTAWTFIKPLLPKKTLHKIQISGHNTKDIVASLIPRMDISVIPEYLGGQNNNFDPEDFISPTKPEKEKQMEFSKMKKTPSTMPKMGRSKVNEFEEFQQVEMVTNQSQAVQMKKSNSKIFSLFDNVGKTFGFSFRD